MSDLNSLFSIIRSAPLFQVHQETSSDTDGGSISTAGSEVIRPLNTVVSPTGIPQIEGASLSDPYITLPAGEYLIHSYFPLGQVGTVNTVFKNNTAIILQSMSHYAAALCGCASVIFGRFELASSSSLLHFTHQTGSELTTETYNLGRRQLIGDSENEIHARVFIWKIDETRKVQL